MLKESIKNLLPIFFQNFIKKNILIPIKINHWKKAGNPIPPPNFVKQAIVKKYKNQFKYNILIETGTFLGDMIDAQKNNFKKLISIELSKDLAQRAKERFKNHNHIEIINGDSGKILKELAPKIKFEPIIFWLDGHYSAGITKKGDKDTPILEELNTISKNNNNHVILIDDARCFTGNGDYPKLIDLINYIKQNFPYYKIEVKDDIIRVFPIK